MQAISQRRWRETGGDISNEILLSVREFHGNGRKRYLMRDWTLDPLGPDYDSALWTVYDGDSPVKDYRLVWDEQVPGNYRFEHGDSYNLGLAQVSHAPYPSPDTYVKYFHADQIGTTRAMSDDVGPPLPPAIAPRLVFTAFGESVSVDGTVGTRYLYAGKHGYESFDWTQFQHVGARWYDPATGRFLQRDPLGIHGGYNVYVYSANMPVLRVDPTGLWFWEIAGGIIGGGVTGAIGGFIIGGGFPGALAGLIGGGVAGGINAAIGEIISGGQVTVTGAMIGGGVVGIPGGVIAGGALVGAGSLVGIGIATGGVAGAINGGIQNGWPGAIAGGGIGTITGGIGGAAGIACMGTSFDIAFGAAYGSWQGLLWGW